MKEQNKNRREERVREAAGRLNDALGALPPKFFEEAYGTEKTKKRAAAPRARKTLAAPAWLRPVAACLAVLLLGGLVVFSIPVVNNIISRRAPAELPGTDLAEADSKEEEEETEKPEESLLDKKHTVCVTLESPDASHNRAIAQNTSASFNDLMKDENRVFVASAADAERIAVGMPICEVQEILGCRATYGLKGGEWALDDGRILRVDVRVYTLQERYDYYGIVDPGDELPIESFLKVENYEEKERALLAHAPLSSVQIYENPERWERLVEKGIMVTACTYFDQNMTPSWGDYTFSPYVGYKTNK